MIYKRETVYMQFITSQLHKPQTQNMESASLMQ